MSEVGWFFQCNPDRFRIFDAVADGVPITNWSVKQYRNRMAIGDLAVLWISGSEPGYPAGVYGTGRIRSLTWKGVVDRHYWVGQPPEPTDFVDIAFDRWLFHHPIGVDELKRDRLFNDALILRFHNQTNYPLSSDQWAAVDHRVPKRRPTSRPRLTRQLNSLTANRAADPQRLDTETLASQSESRPSRKRRG